MGNENKKMNDKFHIINTTNYKKNNITIVVIIIAVTLLIIFRPGSIVESRRAELQEIISHNYQSIDLVIVECKYNGQNEIIYNTSSNEFLNLFIELYETSSKWEGTSVGYRVRDYNVKVSFYKNNKYLYHLNLEIIADDSKIKCNYYKHVINGKTTEVYSLYSRQLIDEKARWQKIFDDLRITNEISI